MENENNILENVARISADYMVRLVDIFHGTIDSKAIIFDYIIPWAKEAEEAYVKTWDEREAEGDYLDWLDAFVENKIKELTGTT